MTAPTLFNCFKALLLAAISAVAITACGNTLEGSERAPEAVPSTAVIDDAGILTERYEKAQNQALAKYWGDTETAIVIHTVESLPQQSIEEFSLESFNTWGIGAQDKMRGILITIVPNDHETRISVGCGLENVITDEIAKEIVDEALVPAFRASDWEEGATRGIEAIKLQIEESPIEPGPVSEHCRRLMGEK